MPNRRAVLVPSRSPLLSRSPDAISILQSEMQKLWYKATGNTGNIMKTKKLNWEQSGNKTGNRVGTRLGTESVEHITPLSLFGIPTSADSLPRESGTAPNRPLSGTGRHDSLLAGPVAK